MGWPKGVSGNPGGRPKALASVVEAARGEGVAAIETLAAIMRDEAAPAAARALAANSLLDRGYGKPTQPLAAGDQSEFADLSDEDIERLALGAPRAGAPTRPKKSPRLVRGGTRRKTPKTGGAS